MAVGQAQETTSGAVTTLAERWDGRQWAIVPTPNPSSNLVPGLASVSCPVATFCVAVGTMTSANAPISYQPLVETYRNATWSLTSVSAVPGNFNAFNSVSCDGPHTCLVAGQTGPPQDPAGAGSGLLEALTPRGWSVVTSSLPSMGYPQSDLGTVSCPSVSFCMATGSYRPSSTSVPFAVKEGGGKLTELPMPAVIGNSGNAAVPAALSCTAGTACTAVSGGGTGVANGPIAFGWDGKAWGQESPVGPGPLVGLSCQAASCTAIGTDFAETKAPSGGWVLQNIA